MKRFVSIFKNNIIFILIIHCTRLCLVGTNRNFSKFFNFFLLSTLTSIFESLPIMIVVPFIGIITNSEKAFENKLVKSLGNLININDPEKLMLPITLIFISIIIFSALMKFLNTIYLTNFNATLQTNYCYGLVVPYPVWNNSEAPFMLFGGRQIFPLYVPIENEFQISRQLCCIQIIWHCKCVHLLRLVLTVACT